MWGLIRGVSALALAIVGLYWACLLDALEAWRSK